MPKFCPECGFKLERVFNFCPECGFKISSGKNRPNIQVNKNSRVQGDNKNLNPKLLGAILLGAAAIVLIILYSSGTFETEEVINNQTNQNTQINNNPSGVNLNNIQMINDLESKVKQNPEDYTSLLQLAHLKNDSGLFEAAIQNYKTYLGHNPKDADARVDMGVCYFNLKDFSNAITEMETALKYVPDHQIAHLNLGVVNLSAGNIDKAKEWLKKAYEINPSNDIGTKAQNLLNNH